MIDDNRNVDFSKLRDEFRHERRRGDTHKAYSLIKRILNSAHAELSDFFSAGECALRLHFFSDAVEHMSKTIDLSKENHDEYYLDQAYFWRAYASFKLKNFTSAISDLDSVKQADGPFYVYSAVPKREVVAYSVNELADMIKAAASSDGV